MLATSPDPPATPARPLARTAAAWLAALLLAHVALICQERARPDVARAPGPPRTGEPQAGLDPALASPRELRALPGIGRTRALAIARERWRRGGEFPPMAWSALDGIGQRTVDGVVRWLAGR